MLHCPATQYLRDEVDWQALRSLPDSVLLGGLFPHSRVEADFYQALDDLPRPAYEEIAQPGEVLQLFTDGSCSCPANPSERLAAFAVTMAEPGAPDNMILLRSLLPGRRQCIFRAELSAVLYAMTMGPAANIHCDNRSVVLGCHRLQQFGWQEAFWDKKGDLDLWREIFRLLSRTNTFYTFVWVRAHRDLRHVSGSVEIWRVLHNRFADSAASLDGTLVPGSLAEQLALLKAENSAFAQIRAAIHGFHRSIWDAFLP